MKNDIIEHVPISELDVKDTFFESLVADYPGFEGWFMRKRNEKAYILREEGLRGFLYLKTEDEADNSITPAFLKKKRLKIGTFKIDSRGTVLGERFISIILQKMINEKFPECYVTVFEKQEQLIKLFQKFGFEKWGEKDNGEHVYVKNLISKKDSLMDYPRVQTKGCNFHLLSIYPKYHTKLFPYSKLVTERNHVIEDLAFTNTIEKVYLAAMSGIRNFKAGDVVVIYRTAEFGKPAEWSAVTTSICSILDVTEINKFNTKEEFIKYCGKGTVFSEGELNSFWNSKEYPFIIKMLYNIPLAKRIVRHDLIGQDIIDRDTYAGVIHLSENQFSKLLELGEVNEDFIIN